MLIRRETLSPHISLPGLLSVAPDTDSLLSAQLSTLLCVLKVKSCVCACARVGCARVCVCMRSDYKQVRLWELTEWLCRCEHAALPSLLTVQWFSPHSRLIVAAVCGETKQTAVLTVSVKSASMASLSGGDWLWLGVSYILCFSLRWKGPAALLNGCDVNMEREEEGHLKEHQGNKSAHLNVCVCAGQRVRVCVCLCGCVQAERCFKCKAWEFCSDNICKLEDFIVKRKSQFSDTGGAENVTGTSACAVCISGRCLWAERGSTHEYE